MIERNQFRAAIIGCGRIAGIRDFPRSAGDIVTHAQAYCRHPATKIVSVYDIDQQRMDEFQRGWGIPLGAPTIDALLSETAPDVISICSPSHLHYYHLISILHHPHPPRVIFVEKPLCQCMEEFDEIERIATDRNVFLLVNHTRRFSDGFRKASALIRSGTLGDLLEGFCDYYGGWLNNGTHVVDTLLMLIGSGLVINQVTPGKPGRLNDPCWDIDFLKEKALIRVRSFDEKYYQISEFDLRFERGRLLIRDFGAKINVETVITNEIGERVLQALPDSPWNGLESPMYAAIETIVNYLGEPRGDRESYVTLPLVRSTMELVWEVNQQTRVYEESFYAKG